MELRDVAAPWATLLERPFKYYNLALTNLRCGLTTLLTFSYCLETAAIKEVP